MFIDHVRVKVTAGAGGDGCMSFRREKYVPLGGPDGGDGGDGGSVFFEATPRLTSLLDLKYHAHWKGERGEHGKGSDCHGKCRADLLVQVPCGTVVRDFHTGEILGDLIEEGQRFCAAKGGRGGKGNARFASSTNRAPRFAEKGQPGEEREFLLELKLIAEIGIVGLPNAGKSTLLASITAATPKIADYPFTTITPNLGMVKLGGYRTLSVADIPGIIEGAAQGKGLGHDFLRHIERTRVLLFMIDLGDEDPIGTRDVLEKELEQHSPVFAARPRLYALNKADVTENRERFELVKEAFSPVFRISAATGDGLPELLEALWNAAETARRDESETAAAVPEPEHEYTFEAPFLIFPAEGGGYRVEGAKIQRAVQMTNFDNPEGVRHLQHLLERMGLFKALKRFGVQPGETIFIGDFEMEYEPD